MPESKEEMDEFLHIYLEESEEEADQIVDLMLKLEQSPSDHASLREAFRLLHTFKGSTGMMGFERINGLAHELETRFDAYRDGRETLTSETVSITLRCVDFFREFLTRLRDGNTDQGDPRPLIDELVAVAAAAAEQSAGAAGSTAERAGAVASDLSDLTLNEQIDRQFTQEEIVADLMADAEFVQEDTEYVSFDGEAAGYEKLYSTDEELDEAINDATTHAILEGGMDLDDAIDAELQTQYESAWQPPEAPATSAAMKNTTEGPLRTTLLCVRMNAAMELPELKARLIVARLQSLGEVRAILPKMDDVDNTPPPVTLKITLRTIHTDDRLIEALDMEGVDAIYFGDLDEVTAKPVVAEPKSAATTTPPTEKPVVVGELETDVEDKSIDAPFAGTGLAATGTARKATGTGPRNKSGETIRIGIDRLDRLMNLAGELAVTNARFAQLADEMRLLFRAGGSIEAGSPLADSLMMMLGETDTNPANANHSGLPMIGGDGGDDDNSYRRGWMERGRRVASNVSETVDQLARLSKSLQHAVLETRMVPVGPLFGRFRRIVRDLSMRQGKQVRLELEGESTELDKRMVDELGDPMVHLIRNSLDHGVESPEKRLARGKPAEGVIRLRAFHQSNNVVIEISDDGAGVDATRIRQRALERGLATAAGLSQMSDNEVYGFIWQPGFSTAEKVSDISGRGVGMDVVKERIAALGGAVELDSRPGRGSTVTLRLPLTLAIVNSLIVRFRGFRLAIPVTDVCEVVGLQRSEVFNAQGKAMIDLRGHLVPLYQLDELFNWNDALPRATTPTEDWVQAVLVRDGHRLFAIEVEDLEGNSDVVIKSLDEHFAHIPGLSGACVMGDGGVCLVIDAASLSICKSSYRTAPKLPAVEVK